MLNKSAFLTSWNWAPKGLTQVRYREAISNSTVVFAHGPAGTGKTLVATYAALEKVSVPLRNGGIEQLVVSRPLIAAGEQYGSLPGGLDEKVNPYLQPVLELIKKSDHPLTQELLFGDSSKLRGMAVGMMRGLTFDDSFVIIDEAQNLTKAQFEMALTRIGSNCKMVFCGDPTQSDLKPGQSGFMHAIKLMGSHPKTSVIEFTADDVQRDGIVGDVIRAYANDRAGTAC